MSSPCLNSTNAAVTLVTVLSLETRQQRTNESQGLLACYSTRKSVRLYSMMSMLVLVGGLLVPCLASSPDANDLSILPAREEILKRSLQSPIKKVKVVVVSRATAMLSGVQQETVLFAQWLVREKRERTEARTRLFSYFTSDELRLTFERPPLGSP